MNTIQPDSNDKLLPSEYMISQSQVPKDGVQIEKSKEAQGDGVKVRSKTPVAKKLKIIPESGKKRKNSNMNMYSISPSNLGLTSPVDSVLPANMTNEPMSTKATSYV